MRRTSRATAPESRRALLAGGTAMLVLAHAGCATRPDRPLALGDLAPTGRLRAGINFGNSLLTKRPAPGGSARGVAVDLAGELARRLGVPLALVTYDTPGQAADAVGKGEWDVVFIAAGPERAATIDFSPPYVQLEATYLVAPGSSIQSVEEVDRPGVRVGVGAKTAYELYLTRTLKRAELVRVTGNAEAIELMRNKQVDAVGALTEMLHPYTAVLPGARVLPGHFALADQAVGTPKGRTAGAQFLRQFVEEAKSSGLVADVIRRNGVRGVVVAPPAKSE